MDIDRKVEILKEVYTDLTVNLVERPKLTFSTSMKTTAGRAFCHHWKDLECSEHEIELNLRMIELNPILSMLTTLYHEYAHIVADCKYGESQGHNRNWVRVFADISGLNPKGITRCHSQKTPPTGYRIKEENPFE